MTKFNHNRRFLLSMTVLVAVILFFSVVVVFFVQRTSNGATDQVQDNPQVSDAQTHTQIQTEGETEPATEGGTESATEPTTQQVILAPKVSPFEPYIKLNPDFVGWIKIQGTNIDSPLVQGDDNNHYLKFNYKNQRQSSGAIYLDYRNAMDFYDNHMAIYGHFMKSGTVFHDLHLFKDPDFFEKNRIIEVQGLNGNATYEIFSVQLVDADDYYLLMDLDMPQMLEYARYLSRASMHKRSLDLPIDVTPNTEIKILTLCTCTYEFGNARILIHAIKK